MMAPDPGCGHAISGEKWTGPICGLWRGLCLFFIFLLFIFQDVFFLFFFFDVDEKQTGTFGVHWFYVVLLVVLLIVRKKNPKFQIL